jgi:hypothetical protein
MDIRGMKRPFGNLPIPSVLTDRRVMGIMRFIFCDANNIGEIELFDAGYFSLWKRQYGTARRSAVSRIAGLSPPGFMAFRWSSGIA